MNKKILSIVVISIIVLCAVSIGVFLILANSQIKDMFKPEQEETNEASQLVKSGEESSLKGALKECSGDSVLHESFRNYCITTACDVVMPAEDKIKKCYEMYPQNVEIRDDCLMSNGPEEIEICNQISDQRYDYNTPKGKCYSEVAMAKKDDSICDKIEDYLYDRLECYKNVAGIKKDSSICDKISEDYFNNWCAENPESYLCKWSWDESKEGYREWCMAVSTSDVSKCDSVQAGEKVDCYLDLAIDKKDVSICEKLNYKENCYLKLAGLTKDVSICDKISNERGERGECLILATENPNASICEKLEDRERYKCFINLALIGKSFSLCENLELGTEVSRYMHCHFSVLESIAEDLKTNISEEDLSVYKNQCPSQSLYEYLTKQYGLDYEADRKKEIEEEESKYSNCGNEKGEYEMRAYDSEGRAAGSFNGEVKYEIPNSFYHEGYYVGVEYYAQSINIFKPSESYIYEFSCTKDGSYKFSHYYIEELDGFSAEDVIPRDTRNKDFNFSAYNIPCSAGETHQYHFDWKALYQGEEGASVFIDKDGDGLFEKTIKSDRELTCEEFLDQASKD